MIIDTHAHIGKMLIFDMPEEDLLYSIEKYGIDFSLVSNIEGSEFDEHGKPVPDFLVKSQNTKLTGGNVEIGGSVAPSGQGALCGMPFCAYSGAPQTGKISSGT